MTPKSICDGVLQHSGQPRSQLKLDAVRCFVSLACAAARGSQLWSARTCGRPFVAWSETFSNAAAHVEHVSVPCASSGHITVSLYNVSQRPATTPVLLYLPPLPRLQIDAKDQHAAKQEAAKLLEAEGLVANWKAPPDFLLRQHYPVVAIHYRWFATPTVPEEAGGDAAPSRLWPTPLHDVLFGYDWLKKQLAPPLSASAPSQSPDGRRHHQRRDLYVYGSHLGGGLAAALALTETHPTQRVAIRGVAAYNGIYNWTAFVGTTADGIPVADDAAAVNKATPGTSALSTLFRSPADLFDSFASPSLLFRTTGHLLPPLNFEEGVGEAARRGKDEGTIENKDIGEDDNEASETASTAEPLGTTRKAYLGFPPLRSTLAVPSALLLHEPATVPTKLSEKPKRSSKSKETAGTNKRRAGRIPEARRENNSYAMQAEELASLMRRSFDKVETKRRREQQSLHEEYVNANRRDDELETESRSTEAHQRVRRVDVGRARNHEDAFELNAVGQRELLDWLDEQMGQT